MTDRDASNAEYVSLVLTSAEVRVVMVAMNHAILDSRDVAAQQTLINARDQIARQS